MPQFRNGENSVDFKLEDVNSEILGRAFDLTAAIIYLIGKYIIDNNKLLRQ